MVPRFEFTTAEIARFADDAAAGDMTAPGNLSWLALPIATGLGGAEAPGAFAIIATSTGLLASGRGVGEAVGAAAAITVAAFNSSQPGGSQVPMGALIVNGTDLSIFIPGTRDFSASDFAG
jgi:hypothetical protein